MCTKYRSFFVLFMLLLCSSPSLAANYFVRNWGNDSNSGTSFSPFRSIKKAAEVATNGDTVDVGAGTYVDNVVVDKRDGSSLLRFRASGAAVLPPGTQMKITRSNNVEVDGFIFQGPTERCFVWRQSTKGVVKNCQFKAGTKGVKVRSGDVVFDTCRFEDFSGDGMQIFGTADVNLVNCTVQRNQETGIEVNENARLTVQDSYIQNNTLDGIIVGPITAKDDVFFSAPNAHKYLGDAILILENTHWDGEDDHPKKDKDKDKDKDDDEDEDDDDDDEEDAKKKGSKLIDEAIEELQEALNPDFWMDEYHPAIKKGDKYYKSVKDAIKKLTKLLDKPEKYGIDDPQVTTNLNQAIEWLLTANEMTSQLAIDEAILGNGDAKEIEKAQKEMAKAQEEMDKGHLDHVSDKYRKAWERAAEKADSPAYGSTVPADPDGGSDNDDLPEAIAKREIDVKATEFRENKAGLRLSEDIGVSVKDCLFAEHATWGVVLWEGATLTDCTFDNNQIGGLWMNGLTESEIDITSCTFTGNGQMAVYAEDCTLTVNAAKNWTISGSDTAFTAHNTRLTLQDITVSGCATAGVSVGGGNGELVVTNVTFSSNGYGIATSGTKKATVTNCVLNQNAVGLYAYDTSTVTLQNCVVSNNSLWGATIGSAAPGSTSTTFTGCTVNHNAGGLSFTNMRDGDVLLKSDTLIRDNTAAGLHFDSCTFTLSGQAGNWRLLRNSNGISCRASTLTLAGITIEESLDYGVKSESSFVTISQCQWTGKGGVYADSNNHDVTINASRLTASAGGGWGVSRHGGNLTVKNSVFAGFDGGLYLETASPSEVAAIYNNTFAELTGTGVHVNGGSVSVRNTIFSSASGTTGIHLQSGSFTHTHNLLYGFVTPFSGTSVHETEVIRKPQFVDALTDDFHLAKGSPAINGGFDLSGTISVDLDGNARPSFNAFEIGAYEYMADDGSFRILTWSEKK